MQGSSHLVAPKPSLTCQFPCLLHPPPTHLEWLPLCRLSVLHGQGHVYRPISGSESSAPEMDMWPRSNQSGIASAWSQWLVEEWHMTQINQPHQCQPQEFCWNYWEKNKRAGTLFQKTNRYHRMERTFVKIKPSQKKAELHKGRNQIPEGIIWRELCLNLNFPWTFQL